MKIRHTENIVVRRFVRHLKNQRSESLNAVVAQLVERQLPKLKVVGSRPIYRSKPNMSFFNTILQIFF